MTTDYSNPYAPPLPPAVLEDPVELLPPRSRPRVWTVFVAVSAAFGLTIALQIVASIGLAIYLLATGVSPNQMAPELMNMVTHPGVFILMAATGQVSFGLGALVPAWLSKVPLRERLGWLPVRCSQAIYPLSMIGSLFPLGVGLALAHVLAWYVPGDPSVAKLYENLTLPWAVPFVLFIALAPGLCEELMFRGYVQQRLLARWRPWLAIFISSLVFGVMHIMPHAVIFAFLLGLWFGVVAWKSGSILPTVCCHAFVNGGLNAWRMVVKFAGVPETADLAVNLGGFVVGAICFVAAIVVLWKTAPAESLPTLPASV